MEYRKFGSRIVLRLDKGDEIVSSVLETAAKENIALASVYGIGGTDFAKVGVFNTEKKAYDEFELRGTHEITSLTGNINTMA
ncbi:MAG: DNA-binding protein, partial [Clostridia bacterium]|nr:DNA-binding protein [Clostridia bacterium]